MDGRVSIWRTSRLLLLTSAVLATLLGAASSASAGTLDQQQTSSNADAALLTTQSVAQTFTAGITGRLDQVDLELLKVGSPPASITVEIRDTSADKPGTGVLATGSTPTSSLTLAPALVPVTFGAPAPVSAGTKYAIVVYSPGTGGDSAGIRYQTGNVYPGGSRFNSSDPLPPGGNWIDTGSDLAFKTYVVPPSPPPASTGQRAAALKKCKKKRTKKARKKCRKKANKLPI